MEWNKGEFEWSEDQLNKALGFRSGDITEAKLMDFYYTKKSVYDFTLRGLLQNGSSYLGDFLMKLTKKEYRREFLIEPDFLGLSYQELSMILGVSDNKINKFRKSQNASDEYGLKFLMHLALICRVPFHWLCLDRIKPIFGSEYLLFLQDITYCEETFGNFLKSANTRNVIGATLIINSTEIYLRIEVLHGQINIEVLQEFKDENLMIAFEELLGRFKPIKGKMLTVVPGKINNGYIINKDDSVLTKPLYFKQ